MTYGGHMFEDCTKQEGYIKWMTLRKKLRYNIPLNFHFLKKPISVSITLLYPSSVTSNLSASDPQSPWIELCSTSRSQDQHLQALHNNLSTPPKSQTTNTAL
jgi:hypothetical protein